jgi:hypothetical protein
MKIIECEYPFVCNFCGTETRFTSEDFKSGYITRTRFWLTSDGFDIICPVCKKTSFNVDLKTIKR